MRELLALISIVVLAALLWLLKASGDKKIIESKDETIQSLQSAVQSKEEIVGKTNAELDSKNARIKTLQEAEQSKDDTIAKDQSLLDSANSLVKLLKDTLQMKEDQLTKNNEIISSYQAQIAEFGNNADDKVEAKDSYYPGDNGFDEEDLGAGFYAYQYFGKTIVDPNHNKQPDRMPNRTPWKFGGNAGIAANNSGFYVCNATNRDSDGTASTSGQAGFLQLNGSSISQFITLPKGTYVISFDYEGRGNYVPNEIAVSVDDSVLFKGAPTEQNAFKRVVTDPICLRTSGKHLLKFRGLSGDTTFIDNVRIDPIHSQVSSGSEGKAGDQVPSP